MNNLSAIIAVRKGSKRVVNKNSRPFADSNLLEIKIQQLLRMDNISNIYVSSDCEKMLSLASKYDVKTDLRDPYYASDSVPMNEVYEYLANMTQDEHILYAHVTSPLLLDSSLKESINKYMSLPNEYDSLATVHQVYEYIWHADQPVNYDPNNHPRSQDLPNYYALNFAVNLITKKSMLSRKNIVGDKFYPFFLDDVESTDVDTELDFKIAEFIYNERLQQR